MQGTPRPALTIAALLLVATLSLGASAPGTQPGRSCLRCGATCDLEPICVCSPGTAKESRVEYDVVCDPICIPGCGSSPWPFGRRGPMGCSGRDDGPCDCPGSLRNRKVLRKETREEETCVVERRVAYLCGPCAGRGVAGCCASQAAPRRPNWWEKLTAWWR